MAAWSGLIATSWGPDRIDLFWLDEDRALWHRRRDGGGGGAPPGGEVGPGGAGSTPEVGGRPKGRAGRRLRGVGPGASGRTPFLAPAGERAPNARPRRPGGEVSWAARTCRGARSSCPS